MMDLYLKLIPVAGAAICLFALLAVTLQLQKLSRRLKAQELKQEDPAIAGLQEELMSLAERIGKLEAEPREAPAAVTIRPGMNLNKRTQALRQYRMGQASGDIAKSLDMPKAEVDLLLKVYRIVSN